MPEAAVDKNHFPQGRKDKIRRARKIAAMQAEAESHAMSESTDDHLRLRICLCGYGACGR